MRDAQYYLRYSAQTTFTVEDEQPKREFIVQPVHQRVHVVSCERSSKRDSIIWLDFRIGEREIIQITIKCRSETKDDSKWELENLFYYICN